MHRAALDFLARRAGLVLTTCATCLHVMAARPAQAGEQPGLSDGVCGDEACLREWGFPEAVIQRSLARQRAVA